MKSKNSTKRFPATSSEWKKAVANAPKRMDDPHSPYDPNDRKSVRAFRAKGKARIDDTLKSVIVGAQSPAPE
ncbi:MAG: hypothetical protein WDO56_24140 [Gammaproteobacteria bacterium]